MHINTICSKCGEEEDDIQLFFTWPFTRAAWFSAPWFIRSDQCLINCNSLTKITLNLHNVRHPYASLQTV
jgi:hypothetical protein